MDINVDLFFQVVKYMANMSTSLFTGGVLYYLITEYPSMMEVGQKHAADHWRSMFKRAGPYNMSLISISILSSFLAYYLRHERSTLYAGIVMTIVFGFSIIVIPTYRTLLTAVEEANLERSTVLIKKWSRYHIVSAVFGLIALSCLFLNL